jgi:hypothetical protein
VNANKIICLKGSHMKKIILLPIMLIAISINSGLNQALKNYNYSQWKEKMTAGTLRSLDSDYSFWRNGLKGLWSKNYLKRTKPLLSEKNWHPRSIKGGIIQNYFGFGYSPEIKNVSDLDKWQKEQKNKGLAELKQIKAEKRFWFTEMLRKNANRARKSISSFWW